LDYNPPLETFYGHTGTISSLIALNDGDSFISASYDATICLWSITRRRQPILCKQHKSDIYCMVLLKRGDMIASGSKDHNINIWKLLFDKNDICMGI